MSIFFGFKLVLSDHIVVYVLYALHHTFESFLNSYVIRNRITDEFRFLISQSGAPVKTSFSNPRNPNHIHSFPMRILFVADI